MFLIATQVEALHHLFYLQTSDIMGSCLKLILTQVFDLIIFHFYYECLEKLQQKFCQVL